MLSALLHNITLMYCLAAQVYLVIKLAWIAKHEVDLCWAIQEIFKQRLQVETNYDDQCLSRSIVIHLFKIWWLLMLFSCKFQFVHGLLPSIALLHPLLTLTFLLLFQLLPFLWQEHMSIELWARQQACMINALGIREHLVTWYYMKNLQSKETVLYTGTYEELVIRMKCKTVHFTLDLSPFQCNMLYAHMHYQAKSTAFSSKMSCTIWKQPTCILPSSFSSMITDIPDGSGVKGTLIEQPIWS